MPHFTMAKLRKQFGKKMKAPDDAYKIVRHREVSAYVTAGTHTVIGEVADSSLNEKGTMVLLETVQPKQKRFSKEKA